jgi:hypothetical protein
VVQAGSFIPVRFRTRSLIAATAILLGIAALVADVRRPPARQWSARTAVRAIHLYQRTASSWMPSVGVRCRFTPTCSRYSVVVIERDGLLRGGWKTTRRLVRCGPWTPMGTSDPP